MWRNTINGYCYLLASRRCYYSAPRSFTGQPRVSIVSTICLGAVFVNLFCNFGWMENMWLYLQTLLTTGQEICFSQTNTHTLKYLLELIRSKLQGFSYFIP